LLYVIEEPLGDKPGDSASEDEDDEYRAHRDMDITVQRTILYSLAPALRPQFFGSSSYEMILGLKDLFIEEVRVMKFEWLDKFFSTTMEENTCLDRHLALMHKIHERLTGDLDYWMADELAIDGVLRSLSPATRNLS